MKQPKDVDLSLLTPDLAELSRVGDVTLYTKEVERYSNASAHDEDRIFEKKIRIELHNRHLAHLDYIATARKDYANKIFLLVVVWLLGIAFVLLLQGFQSRTSFSLDNKVLIALIGGTTLNVLGIFTIVASFLFPKNGQPELIQSGSKKAEEPEKAKTQRAGSTTVRKPAAKATAKQSGRSDLD